jgi:hypothetical protein
VKVAFTVNSEIGLWIEYGPSKSANSKTDHPSALEKAEMPEKKEGQQNET